MAAEIVEPGEPLLRYRAGPTARRILKERGLMVETLGAFVGPASGPKWLVLAGIDRALLDLGLLTGAEDRRTLLVGSSAGGWRILALATADPATTHQGLLAGYIHQVFTDEDTPITVSAAYREIFRELFSDDAVRYIIDHPRLDVALHVVRRRLGRSKTKNAQVAVLSAAMASATLGRRGVERLFEPYVFHSRPDDVVASLGVKAARLDPDNFFDVAMATGSVPIYMDPVSDIAGGSPGLYLDGGLTDYHINRRYVDDADRLVLFPHYRERIAPGWFDKHMPWRKPSRATLDNLLQIFPSDDFVRRLPGGVLPDRQDFARFADDPQERIRRWTTAVSMADGLGRELKRDLESGAYLGRLESF